MQTTLATRQYIDTLHQDLTECGHINDTLFQVIQLLFDVTEVHQLQLPCNRLVNNMTLLDIHQHIIAPLQRYVEDQRRARNDRSQAVGT